MKRIFAGVAILFIAASPAMADKVNSNFVGCITEKALDEFISAAVKSDYRQMEALNGTVCVPIGGLEYSMIDQGFITSEIRIYTDAGSFATFTSTEAMR